MKRTSVKIVLSVAALIGLVLIGLLYFLNYELEDFVRGKLDEQLDPAFEVSFDELDVSLFAMSFNVQGLEVSRSDTLGLLWKASVNRASVDGIHPLQILFSNELKAETVKLYSLEAELHRFSQKQKRKSGQKKKSLTLIVEKMILDDGRLRFEKDSVGYFNSRIQFETDRISSKEATNTPLELSKKISLRLSDVSFVDSDSTQMIAISQLTKERNGKLKLDSLTLTPLMDLKEYSAYHGWRKGRNTIQIKQVLATIPHLVADSIYELSKIKIIEPTIKLEKDMTYDLPDRRTQLPQDALLALGISFNLDSLEVENGRLDVKLHKENAIVAELTLSRVSANAGAQNRTRDSAAFFFSGEAMALNGSMLNVRSEYRYGTNNPWTLSGSLADTDLHFLSDFLQKMAGVEISSGKLNKLQFDMEGNNQSTSGNVTFLYDNLGITAVDKKTGEKKVVLNVLSDVLGSLVFWKENPKNGQAREGNFSIERDVRKAFPSQWIEGLLAGTIESVAKIDPTKIRLEKRDDKNP